MARTPKGAQRRSKTSITWYARAGGKQTQRAFPPDTPPEDIQRWQAAARLKLLAEAPPKAEKGTLSHDIDRFLAHLGPEPQRRPDGTRINGTTTKRRIDGETCLQPWRESFGHRTRRSITRDEMRDFLLGQRQTKAVSTVTHLRTYMLTLWKFLDGKAHQCPLRDIPPEREPRPEPRALPPDALDLVFAELAPCKTKARLQMTWFTGARPHEVMELRPEDIRLNDDPPCVFYHSAKEGDHRFVPLNQNGVAAARLFIETDAWGRFSSSQVHRDFLDAARRAREKHPEAIGDLGGDDRHPSGRRKWRYHPYALRHTCFSQMVRLGADLADVQYTAGHRNSSTTRRYAPVVLEKIRSVMERLERPGQAGEALANGKPTPVEVS